MCANFRFPLFYISENCLKISIYTDIYCLKAINSTCYKYLDNYFLKQQPSESDLNIVDVFIENKEGNAINEIVAKQFCNDLIDQQERINISKEFGSVRNLIVEQAFKPMNK